MVAKTKVKQSGQVYTPTYLVEQVLDLAGYATVSILGKHVIDNSCGDGAFLCVVVKRYIEAGLSTGKSRKEIVRELEDYVHGIELDSVAATQCRRNLDEVARKYDVTLVSWDIETADALIHSRHLGLMDFVVGNPPYVRVHNLDSNYDVVKNNYSFTRGGMTDLYLAFYELGLYMLNDTGVLGYVTPSSFFNSKAGSIMRDYFRASRCLRAVVDLQHYQPFEATTYAAIVVLTKQINDVVDYYTYDTKAVHNATLDYGDFCADDDTFVFQTGTLAQEILASGSLPKICQVKNGITSLLDSFFIGDSFPFDSCLIPVVKASTGKETKCVFPYDMQGSLIPLDDLDDDVRAYFLENEAKLKERDIDKDGAWHGFGRAQGIKDIFVKKYAVSALARDFNDIKLVECPAGTGVYGGLYIVTDVDKARLCEVLNDVAFIDFIKALGKYKSGGYYTYGSLDLQRYLNFMLAWSRNAN